MKTIQTSTTPDVRELFELPVPIVSAYLGGVLPTHEYSAADRHGTVLRAVAQGARPKAVEALRQIIEEIPAEAEATAVFIGADGSRRQFPMPGAGVEDRVVASAVPHLTPLLAWWQAQAAQRRGHRLLEEFADRSGQNGRSVEGVAATLRALARGQVRTLLVTDQAGDGGVAWFGPAATDVALHVTGLTRNGVEPEQGPVIDVAVRSALLGGADVWVLNPETPGAPSHGIGAL